MFVSKYFNIGQVVATYGINNAMMENNRFLMEIDLCMRRYCVKDWGDIADEDKKMNESALQYPDDLYLLGAYQTCKGKICIITNRKSEKPGDNVTTILFSDER